MTLESSATSALDPVPAFLLARIGDLARTTTGDLVHLAAHHIDSTAPLAWPQARAAVLSALPQPELRHAVAHLLDAWQAAVPQRSRRELAVALAAAAQAVGATRQEQKVALVWTGPHVDGPPLRRTDQALQDVIAAARHELLLVSFAVASVPHIAQALVEAARRGVAIRIALDTKDESEGRIDYDTVRGLGAAVAQHAAVYIWPAQRRARSASGHLGALHVKCAVADRSVLFVSSANLTGYAMSINMELGVLVRGGTLPGDVATQFDRLIEHRVLERLGP